VSSKTPAGDALVMENEGLFQPMVEILGDVLVTMHDRVSISQSYCQLFDGDLWLETEVIDPMSSSLLLRENRYLSSTHS
jgi:hypothetical protein